MASAWRAANFLPSSDAPASENNRSALRRAGNIQRPGDFKEIAVVIERMQFIFIKELASLLIAHKGIFFP